MIAAADLEFEECLEVNCWCPEAERARDERQRMREGKEQT